MMIPNTPPSPLPMAGLRVAAFEARMAGPMGDLIRKHGGTPVEAPALREIPIGDNPQAVAFAETLIGGGFDAVIFLTGVGTRYLLQAIEPAIPKDEVLAALARVKVVVRGPKPMAVLREWKVRIDLNAPEPNTWHEVLATLDAKLPVDGLRVAVQEYGKPSPELVAGLEARGATVTRVPVYRWDLPEDTGPLVAAIGEIVEGRIGAVMFTSAQQVVHLLQVAASLGREGDLRAALADRVVVASIGPTTTETLREHDLPVDIEPEHPKMGHLVAALATGWRASGKATTEAPTR